MLKRSTPLRRTGFARPGLVRAPSSAVLRIEGQRGVYTRVSDSVVAVPKEIILRSRPYRMFVAEQECFLCGIRDLSQCAHENGADKAKGLKQCDSRTFPLCAPHGLHMGCHKQFDEYIDISREEARELGAKLSARMRGRAVAAGWKFTPEGIVAP